MPTCDQQQYDYISETLIIVPIDAHYYKIIEVLKKFKNYDTCSYMFRFT